MVIKNEGVLGQNITILYETLDLSTIDVNKLKNSVTGRGSVTAIETPDMIVVLFPLGPLVIQIADRRMRITLQGGKANDSDVLPEIATKCHRIVASKRIKPIAFGFNYDVIVSPVDITLAELLNRLFVSDIEKLNQKIEGSLAFMLPRLIFQRDGARYDLIFETPDEQRIAAHLNVHFELLGRGFPVAREIKASFIKERDAAIKTVLSILNEE